MRRGHLHLHLSGGGPQGRLMLCSVAQFITATICIMYTVITLLYFDK